MSMLATTTSRLASLSRAALLQPRLPVVLHAAAANFSTEGGDLSPGMGISSLLNFYEIKSICQHANIHSMIF